MSDNAVWFRFIVSVLATWRISHLLAAEDGPADLFVRLRRLLGRSFFGRLMDCFYCLSVWVAAPFAFFVSRGPMEWFVTWWALTGAACLLERLGQQPVLMQPLPLAEETKGESDNVLWRRQENSSSSDHEPAGSRNAGAGSADI